jgi:hypothetical protein
MSSQRDGSNQKPTLPSFQSLLRDIDELGMFWAHKPRRRRRQNLTLKLSPGPLNPAASAPNRHDTALSLPSSSAPRNAYSGKSYRNLRLNS